MATLQPAKYGKVIGRLLAVVADGPDEDEYPISGGFPDAVPVAGSVTFTPRATQILVPLATPSPVTAFPTPITAQLDQNGYLTHNGKKGVFLLCPSSATNPPAFTYSVSYNLTLDGAVIGSTKFDLEMVEYVPGPNPSDPDIGSTAVDLTLVTPVYPTPGTPVVRGPKGDSIVDITLSGDGSALVFHIATETGTVTEPVTIPALGDLTAAVGEAEDARDAAQGFAEGASQSRGRAETAADLAVSTAAGIQDVAADAAQVALDRIAVAEDRDVVALDRQAADDAAVKASEDASRGVFDEQVRNAMSRRRERPMRLAVFSDSRGEGLTPNLAEGVQSWADTFPILLARDLRTRLGVGVGGRGWIPLALTGSAAQYRFAVSEFISGGSDLVVGDTGVPGSQWMTEAKTIRIPLSAGCTSVAFVSAPAGGGGYATKLTGQKADRVREWGQDGTAGVLVDALNDPGTYVDVTSGGGGFFALGVIEYCGDESAGVQVLNFSVSGIDSVQMAANVVKPAMAALLDWYSADVSVVALGANDVDHGVGVADSTAAIESILSASGGAPVVMTAVAAGSVSPPWTALNAGIRAMSGVTVSDIAGLIPASNSVNAEGLFLSDGTHLGLSGSGAFSDFLQGTMLGKPLAQAGHGAAGYVLPVGGVPAADLDAAVQASLDRADGSVQQDDSRLTNARPPTVHSHVATDISDSTTVGRNVLKASNAAAARSAIGAGTGNGTSNLAIGTTSSTAMRGDGVQAVASLPGSPVAGILYCIPE